MLCSVPASANEVLWNCPDLRVLQSSPLSSHKHKKGHPDLRASWCALQAMHKKVPVCFLPGVWAAHVIFLCALEMACFGGQPPTMVFPIVSIHRSSSWMAPVSCFSRRSSSIQQQEPRLSVRRSNDVLLTFLQSCQQN